MTPNLTEEHCRAACIPERVWHLTSDVVGAIVRHGPRNTREIALHSGWDEGRTTMVIRALCGSGMATKNALRYTLTDTGRAWWHDACTWGF